MGRREAHRSLCAALGRLLDHPRPGDHGLLVEARARLREEVPAAGECLDRYTDAIAALDVGAHEELYARTFDLMPVCIPYLSVHLFGEQSYARTRLMTGLAGFYESHGVATGTELPDHLRLVLAAAAHFDETEWSDLVELCLLGALLCMRDAAHAAHNPYAHLLDTVWRVLCEDADLGDEEAAARARASVEAVRGSMLRADPPCAPIVPREPREVDHG